MSVVNIDGSAMEGGGQILRMAMGFSALLEKPVAISKIRAGRSKPGLKSQHVNGLQLVGQIGRGSELTGCRMDSARIAFSPGSGLAGGCYEVDVKTAGATTLLAQVSLPCLLFAGDRSVLDLRGGTDAIMAPTVDYYSNVFLPNLRRFGAEGVECEPIRRGYFPRGGGRVRLTVAPLERELQPVTLTDRGTLTSVEVKASVGGTLPESLALEMAKSATKVLLKKLDVEVNCGSRKEEEAGGNGSSVLIVAKTAGGCILGASAVGSGKEKASATGERAAEEMLSVLESGACVDDYMQDQLIIFMALAKGKSRLRTGPLTLHTETAISICQQLSDAKFDVINQDDHVLINCDGIGMKNDDWGRSGR